MNTAAKDPNPKDAIGASKLALTLWPETATILGSLGLLDGALKYGRLNWRATEVRASIYIDACRRHLAAWFEGEDLDPDSEVPHLGHALACIAILVDAQANGTLLDDRQFTPGVISGYRKMITAMTGKVAKLQAAHAGRAPHHYSIADPKTETTVEDMVLGSSIDLSLSFDPVKPGLPQWDRRTDFGIL